MKILSIYFLFIVTLTLGLSSCQPDEVAPLQPGSGHLPTPGKKAPVIIPTSIPPDEVIRTIYPRATKWRITYNNVDVNLGSFYQQYFSTLDGSFQTRAELNSSAKATTQADMNLLFWFIASPDRYNHHLTYPKYASKTRFKPAEFGPWQLAAMTTGNQDQFEDAFERSTYGPTQFQPYNYELDGDGSDYMDEGDIYLFKTGRDPARYGAVNVVKIADPYLGTEQTVIEVTIQSPNNNVELAK